MKNKIFLSVLAFLVLSASVWTLVREPRKISVLENRTMHQFPEIHIKDLINGNFQKDWELALGDQFIGSTTLKRWYNQYKLGSLEIFFEVCRSFLLQPKSPRPTSDEQIAGQKNAVFFEASYIPKGENIFLMEPGGNLVVFDYHEEYLSALREQLELAVNDLNNIQSPLFPKYCLYYIEVSGDIDFANNQITHLFSETARKIFQIVGEFDAFTFDSPEDFQNKMYRSDHHWNHIGQMEGYRDIVRLLLGENEVLLNINPQLIPDIHYTGSRGRKVADFSIWDEFYVCDANLPPYEVIVGGVEEKYAQYYGKAEEYLKGKYSRDNEINHYGECFGQDTGLITYDFHSPERENLLMIVDSYSNPINAWIASHFNRTYIVDLRHYKNYIGTDFSVSEFTFTNNINKILIMGSGTMFRNKAFQLEPAHTSSKR